MSSKLKLRRIDEVESPIELPEGKTTIGRGPVLKCTDKRISRNHAVLEVSNKNYTVLLKSIHVNPCFYQSGGKGKFEIVLKDNEIILKNGDRFSLLPSAFIYEVNAKDLDAEESNSLQTSNNSNESSKSVNEDKKDTKKNVAVDKDSTTLKTVQQARVLPKWLQEAALKRKTDNTDSSESKPKNGRVKKLKATPKKKVEASHDLSDEEDKRRSDSQEEPKPTTKQKNINENKRKVPSGDQTPSSATKSSDVSKPTKTRKPCEYGKNCYRKNPAHFKECSHPGDSDFVEPLENDEVGSDDAADTRPECEFGVDCYRKNPDHRKEYKHTKRQRAATKKAARAQKKRKDDSDDDDDDDDDCDSFIADDDSDDYKPESGSDTEDEIQELVNDAEKFKRNKKLMQPT